MGISGNSVWYIQWISESYRNRFLKRIIRANRLAKMNRTSQRWCLSWVGGVTSGPIGLRRTPTQSNSWQAYSLIQWKMWVSGNELLSPNWRQREEEPRSRFRRKVSWLVGCISARRCNFTTDELLRCLFREFQMRMFLTGLSPGFIMALTLRGANRQHL